MLKVLSWMVCLATAAILQACSASGAEPTVSAMMAAGQAPVPGTYTETDQPITAPTLSSCVVVLGLLKIAIEEGRAQGDAAALEAAGVDYRARLKALMGNDDEANQLIGSSVAFFDELTVAQLRSSADLCLAARDRTFTVDEA